MAEHVNNNVIAFCSITVVLVDQEKEIPVIGRVEAGEVEGRITIAIANSNSDYGVVAVLDREMALSIGKQLIKLAVVTGEHQ